jgi:hypothetical protein
MNGSGSGTGRALGDIALASDHAVKALSPKIDLGKIAFEDLSDVEAMLATYVFDLQRRMEYFFLATQEFGRLGTPHLACRIQQENAWVNQGETHHPNWQERAKRAHALLRQLHEEVGPWHERLLGYVAGLDPKCRDQQPLSWDDPEIRRVTAGLPGHGRQPSGPGPTAAKRADQR